MENCKPPAIEEKKYSCPKTCDTKHDSGKPAVKPCECDKEGGGGGGGGDAKSGKNWCLFPKPAQPCPDQELALSDADMGPPPFSDLGKNAKDVFNKGYHFGLIKLDCKTKTSTGVEFNTGGNSNQESGKVFGSLETKYKAKDYGISFAEKWNTDNVLAVEVALQDRPVNNLKLSGEINFCPHSGSKGGVIKAAYLHRRIAINLDANINENGPVFQGSAVLGYKGFAGGYQGAYDLGKGKLSKSNFALGFSRGDFVINTSVESSDDGREFGGAIFHKITSRLDAGVQVAWTAANSNTKFGMAAKYDLDQDAALRAKVNNLAQIGLGYQQRLREGVTLTMSVLVDGKNFNNGGHKVGLALELEA